MTRYELYPEYQNCYEYHGNTSVEMTRKQAGITIKRDWILFDSVEEAQIRGIMLNKMIDGILDCIFMLMVIMISILGTLIVGL
jgi:hypothetical protein